jgi:hypothetical protein
MEESARHENHGCMGMLTWAAHCRLNLPCLTAADANHCNTTAGYGGGAGVGAGLGSDDAGEIRTFFCKRGLVDTALRRSRHLPPRSEVPRLDCICRGT